MINYKTGFAILGGTFDPVHNGHLQMAIEAGEVLAVDSIKLVPSYHPYHRDKPQTSPENRTSMLELAVQGVTGLEVDPVEYQRKGPSYTVDTLTHYREMYGAQCPLVLLLGEDTFATLTQWHKWEAIGDLAHIAIIKRPGSIETLPHELAIWKAAHLTSDSRNLLESPYGLVCNLDLTLLDISASKIRERIRLGQSIDFLLPGGVKNYIEDNKLYRT